MRGLSVMGVSLLDTGMDGSGRAIRHPALAATHHFL
jgi:hypothetical protein